MKSIDDLYTKNAAIYDKISNDRDFSEQSRRLINYFKLDNKNVVDLFSGPGRHIKSFNDNGANCIGVDSSQEMRRIAISNKFACEEDYVCLKLPARSWPKNVNNVHAFLLFRYSCGYLTISELNELVIKCIKISPNGSGVLIIELHSMKNAHNGFLDLDIIERECFFEGGNIKCRWPSSKPLYDDLSSQVAMPVEIDVYNGNKLKESLKYVSKESIHSFETIQFIANINGLKSEVVNDESVLSYFPNSVVAAIYL